MKRHPAEWGNTVIASTTAQDGRWYMFYFLSDTVFASLTDASGDGWDVSIGGVTFKATEIFFGDFTHVKLASGAMVAYKQRV